MRFLLVCFVCLFALRSASATDFLGGPEITIEEALKTKVRADRVPKKEKLVTLLTFMHTEISDETGLGVFFIFNSDAARMLREKQVQVAAQPGLTHRELLDAVSKQVGLEYRIKDGLIYLDLKAK